MVSHKSMFAFLSRNWFPLALVGLFLLALPGVVLTALALLGKDGDLNDWLQEHWNLSYHMELSPWLTQILLFLPLVLLLLYFLKLKRKPLAVPSTFLWKKSIEDLHVNSLFQWLRQNVLLLLQILVILFLTYAVLGIRFHGGATQAKHYILVIDNSASMAATDAAPSRLHVARQQALKEIDAAGDDDYGMIIVFNSKATTLQSYTKNKARLREAVKSIEQAQRLSRIDEALTLAESLANPVRSTEAVSQEPENVPVGKEETFGPQLKGIAAAVHLFSDGRFAPLSEAAISALSARQTGTTKLLGNLNLTYHMAGQAGADKVNNVGIVAFNAVRVAAGKDKNANPDLLQLQVFVSVRNFRPAAAQVKLRLDVMADGQIVHPEQATLELPKRVVKKADAEDEVQEQDEPGVASANFILPPLDLRSNIVLRAYLDNHQDDLPADDQAWLVVGSVRKAKVLSVGPGNSLLSAFFEQEAARRIATYQHLAADAKDEYRQLARAGEVDLVIFDRCAPDTERDMPLANTFFIGDFPPPWRRTSKTLKNPNLVASKRDHPLLRYLTTLWDLGVAEAHVFDPVGNLNDEVKALMELPERDKRPVLPPVTPLLEAGKTPVLFTTPRGAYTDLVLTFPLLSNQGDLVTNWPLQPSFPLFLRNVLYQLGNVDDSVRSITVQPGEPMVLRPEAGVTALDITAPDGKKMKVERGARPEFSYADTEQLGVYGVVRPDGGRRSFAVNLLDAAESNIEPRAEIHLGGDKYVTGQQRSQPRELWKWILLLALVLLMVEWYIYNKRVAI